MVQIDKTKPLICVSARTAYRSLEKKKSPVKSRKKSLKKSKQKQRLNGRDKFEKFSNAESKSMSKPMKKKVNKIGDAARNVNKIKKREMTTVLKNVKYNQTSPKFQHKYISDPGKEMTESLEKFQNGNYSENHLSETQAKNRPMSQNLNSKLHNEKPQTTIENVFDTRKNRKNEKTNIVGLDAEIKSLKSKRHLTSTLIDLNNEKSKKRKFNSSSGSLESFIAEKYTKLPTSSSMIGEDSLNIGFETFEKIIYPVKTADFFKHYWEKSYLVIRGNGRDKFKGVLSTADIDNMLRMNRIMYTKNIDVTSYKDGERQTHNPEGRAMASSVWDFYNSGCSVRMLNPQTFHRPVWSLLATLQEYFNSFCGANVYLTPPGTQGFAPHWDDIEAFILQLEGKKRWRVYGPRNVKEELPRYSSGNFGPSDRLGPSLLDCVLEPGDLLYFPRGFIHQGEALPDEHSLHITISTYQKNAWVDLLEKLLPATLAVASEEDVEFRAGLPIDYLQCAGVAISDAKSRRKEAIKEKVTELVSRMMDFAPIDEAIDQMAKGFIYDSLPPLLTSDEIKRTVFEGDLRWCSKANSAKNGIKLSQKSSIRLIRRGCVRLIVEENSVRLYNTIENSREYHEEEPKYIEISPEVAPAVEFLILNYPKYVQIKSLPLSAAEDKMTVAGGLWEKGIIRVL